MCEKVTLEPEKEHFFALANLEMKKFAQIYIFVGNENITASHTFHYVNRCYFTIIFEYISRNF